MKTICRACGMAFPVQPEFVGCTVTCPHCGDSHTLQSCEIIRKTATVQRSAKVETDKGFSGLGFVLGLFLNVPGVFIAGAVNGRRGMISALWGLLIDGIVILVGYGLMAAGM